MPHMDLWTRETLKSAVLPGGVLLLISALLLNNPVFFIPAVTLSFYYYAVFVAGLLIAWRFHCSRVLFAIFTLLLAHRAVEFFSGGPAVGNASGRVALKAVAFLIPLNFTILSFARERGFVLQDTIRRLAVLFFESVLVAVICRPGYGTQGSPHTVHPGLAPVEQSVLWMYIAACGVLLIRLLLYHKPLENGLFWSLAATLIALRVGVIGREGDFYFATAGLILASSMLESSYALAFHDELTGLSSRRAFNDALLRLDSRYAIAVVDIDHFKGFNDTYGHETGDEVLRMVASKLAHVTGGGTPYRIGGEEFCILFPGKSLQETISHLELVRKAVAASEFRVRSVQERRSTQRMKEGLERRNQLRRLGDRSATSRHVGGARQGGYATSIGAVSVTVSVGVAEPTSRARSVDDVLQSADQALYHAKQSGRNRVEAATTSRVKKAKVARPNIA
jgi:diguanylate cyclase (GGDEF)-like protein